MKEPSFCTLARGRRVPQGMEGDVRLGQVFGISVPRRYHFTRLIVRVDVVTQRFARSINVWDHVAAQRCTTFDAFGKGGCHSDGTSTAKPFIIKGRGASTTATTPIYLFVLS